MKRIIVLLSIMSVLSVLSVSAEEMSAAAKAECTKLDSTYMSMKNDYAKLKKSSDQNGNKGKVMEMVSADKGIRELEKKFKAVPVTTPEAKQLKAKLLKQLQLGRDLTKDEAAALEKNGK